MFTIQRPKPGETEEDLLRQQEEFLKSRAVPSAKLIRMPDKRRAESASNQDPVLSASHKDVVSLGGLPGQFEHTTTAPPVKRSKFKERRQQHTDTENQFEKQDTHITKVLREIVERDIRNVPVYYPDPSTFCGFPTAPHRGATQDSEGNRKKRSIFAQQFANSVASDFGVMPAPQRTASRQCKTQGAPNIKAEPGAAVSARVCETTGSVLVSGRGLNPTQAADEAAQIHQENVSKMAAMSEAEILDEQCRLTDTLDPNLLAFFRSKRNPAVSSGGRLEGEGEDGSDSAPSETPLPAPMEVSQPPADEESLPMQPSKKWAHMDCVEAEKLEWTKDLPPPPKADSFSTGQPARFDLRGAPVAVDADVSTQLGLHHHGNEPERAGYTLQELFQLARSANMQQRVMALTTIARIICKARDGLLSDTVATPLIPALLDGGLMHIVRWALDDVTENTMTSAVLCLHALLVCQQDEDGLDRSFSWHQGTAVPSLQPLVSSPGEGQEKETDAAVLKVDVIKGLLRMQLLPRLRYLLEVWRPPGPVTIHILQVLIRIARHCATSAYEISKCPRLLDVIFKEFLPTTWVPVDTAPGSSLHGFPVPEALKLIRVICTAGSNMAASMVSNYWLMTCVSRYVVEDPSDLQLPEVMGCQLQLEALRVWQIVTMYGLASQSFSDLYPVLMTSLQSLVGLHYASNPVLLQWAVATVQLLEAVVALAATSHTVASLQNSQPSADGVGTVAGAVPTVQWRHVTGLYQPVEVWLQNALTDFTNGTPSQKVDLTFASCCLNFAATYISKMETQHDYDPVEGLQRVQHLAASCILPCITSPAFYRAFHTTRDHSVLLHPGAMTRREVSPALPEVGALVSNGGDVCPLLRETSTMHFVLAAVRLVAAMGRVHKGLATQLAAPVLQAGDVLQYVRRCCKGQKTAAAQNHFARFDTFLQWYLLHLARLVPEVCDAQLFHQMALFMLPRIQQGDEYLAHDLLSTIIFNPDFFGDLETAEQTTLSDLEQLRLSDPETAISSAALRTTATSRPELAADITQHLPAMRAAYLGSAGSELAARVQRSRARIVGVSQNTLLLPLLSVAPVDWPFVPLVELYNSCSQAEETPSPQVVSLVTNSLRLIYALERWRPGVLDPVNFVTKLSRIMCTFLAGSDLFLDAGVHRYLEAILKLYCRPVFLTRMDFTKKVPGLMSFYDFYIQFVEQFDAVSFGDALFACYVLLPAQQRHDVQLRRALWGEHRTTLRALTVPISEMPVPLENFLQPDETDLELIKLYYQALYSGCVTSGRCPLLHLVAIHHVNRFVYLQEAANRTLRYAMLAQLSKCPHPNIERDVLFYKRANPQAESVMEFYTELPDKRANLLREAKAGPVS